MQEEWRNVVGYENLYEVSNLGRIRSLNRKVFRKHWTGVDSHMVYKGKMIPFWVTPKGYFRLTLNKDSKKSNHLVHRLVANAFIPKIEGKELINHKNGVKSDNRVENLEWVTNQENIIHAYQNGLFKKDLQTEDAKYPQTKVISKGRSKK
jgi:hypothetical protein